MKRILLALAITLFAVSSAQAADVGVSISIGQPGFYGRVDLGPYPQPAVVYAHPVVVRPVPVVVTRPVYVYAPPGHVKRGYSRYYGRPAYVVHDRWYPVPVHR
jgi:hypothetical protein